LGVPQGDSQAAALYRLAAEQGNATAQFNLALLLDNGEGVDKDYAQAAQWYRKAAEQGVPRAQFNLGAMYANGDGVALNFVEAYFWLDLAAQTWNGSHQQEAVSVRDKVALRLSTTDLLAAKRRAKDWLEARK
jgi:hypothetical protein